MNECVMLEWRMCVVHCGHCRRAVGWVQQVLLTRAVRLEPLHHIEMALPSRNVERGRSGIGRLGDRPAVPGKPLHHLEMALVSRNKER